MSIATGIALIIGLFLFTGFLYFYLSVHANKYGNQILTGMVQGVRVSMDYRWVILYWHWSGFAFGAAVSAFLGMMLSLTIANHAPHQDIGTVAYTFAFISGIGSLGWFASIFVEFRYYRSVLRQAEVD